MPIQILSRLYKRNSVKANEGQCFKAKFALIQMFFMLCLVSRNEIKQFRYLLKKKKKYYKYNYTNLIER